MDLVAAMKAQIIESNQENKRKEEERKKAIKEEKDRKEQENKDKERAAKTRFEMLKDKIESSPLREVMETLAQELNSPNQSEEIIRILKARIVELARDGSKGPIKDDPQFLVDKPRYEGGVHGAYHIRFYTVDLQYLQNITIFSVSYSEKTGRFGFHMNLGRHDKHFDFTLVDQESMAREIIKNLMAE